jgi:NAD(P)H-hydrate epimerase
MSDIATRLYTAEQVRSLDACAITERGIPGYELMKRAGAAVFEAAKDRFPDAQRWLCLCGAGNNGGDGYVIARLARNAGIEVTVCALANIDGLSGDAATAAADWLEEGGTATPWPLPDGVRADLVIDAMLGTGLDRELSGAYREAVDWVGRLPCPAVAVDIPTGLHADTGCVMGAAVRASLTVSLIGLKRGVFTADGPDHCGEVLFDGLGTPADIHAEIPGSGTLLRESRLESLLPVRLRGSHKGHFGHVLVVGGAPGMSGAARLAGEAALRSGAGLVSVATHPAHASMLNIGCPELMVSAVDAPDDLGSSMDRASVLASGPGLGQSNWGHALLTACLESELPLVLDADGLNLLAGQPCQRGHWVLTPHPAEAARLLQCSTGEIQRDRVEQAVRLAQRFAAVVVLKGCGTVVAAADGRYAICALGNPGMATRGSGDVLTGIIAGFLAQGLDPWEAAQAGVVAHAAAGDLVAATQGERGMLASDISTAFPAVVNP